MSQRLDRLIHTILHLPWWVWVLGLVVTVLLVFGVMRAHGAQRWRGVQRDIAACGLETDPARWVERAPVPDPARQAELRRLLEGMGGWTTWNNAWQPRIPSTAYEGSARQGSAHLLAEGAADMRAIEALLDQGPVLLSMLGWLPRDADHLRSMEMGAWAKTYIPSLIAVRACALWWANQAAVSDDPLPSLRRLEHWTAACDPAGSLIDGHIGIALHSIRNEALLWLACQGRLPTTEAQRWLAEPAQLLRAGAAGLASERLFFIAAWRHLPLTNAGWQQGYGYTALMPTLNHDVAWACREMAAGEAILLGLPLPAACPPPPLRHGSISVFLPDVQESCAVFAETQFSHRARRIAGLLAVRYRHGEALPADREALAALLPAGQLDEMTANSPALFYERLAPSRFRLGIAANARPPLIPAGRWNLAAQPRYGSTIGQPPAIKAVEDCRWSYELDLDAVLVPPPASRH